MSAYLLAEEEALGGEDGKAICRRALCCTVCAGRFADFSLLLLVQIKQLEHGPSGRGHTTVFPQVSPITNSEDTGNKITGMPHSGDYDLF